MARNGKKRIQAYRGKMMKLNLFSLTSLTFLLVVTYWGIGSPVVNSQGDRIGTVTVINDDVFYNMFPPKNWVKLKKPESRSLYSGDLIKTSKLGRARIKCSKGREWPILGNQVAGVNNYCLSVSPKRSSTP